MIKFEYQVWNLSSESIDEREIHYKKIISMGRPAIPYIIKELNHSYIFQDYYLLNSLEKITGIDSVKNLSISEKKNYWKDWWNENKYIY